MSQDQPPVSALNDAQLLAWAGQAAYARGRGYHADERIRLTRVGNEAIEAQASGTDLYELWLRRRDGVWQWGCSCPAAEDGSFCKHLVAAALAWRGEAVPARGNAVKPTADALGPWLRQQPAERLADWLLVLAREDRDIAKRLHLYRDSDNPETLKKALGKMLSAGGFLDYRASLRYAQKLDLVLAQLREQLARDAQAGRELCEYALGRLLRVYENSDDSAGAIGDQLRCMAELHAQACATAPPPGKQLAAALHALHKKDDWNLFPLPDYWTALGVEGQTIYGRLVLAEIEPLLAKPADGLFDGGHRAELIRVEAYARVAGDFDLLQRVLRWDLSHAVAHLRVIDSLHEAGRAREALQWAEQATKRFPTDTQLRLALAEQLRSAGLEEEATAQCWEVYRLQPHHEHWAALKAMTDADWPVWRQRALDEIGRREQAGDATLRVDLLLRDGDVTAAGLLAEAHTVQIDALQTLAQRSERDAPARAAGFWLRCVRALQARLESRQYEKLVSMLQRLTRLLPEPEWRPLLQEIRQTHRAKRSLMALLNAAGL